MNNDALCIRTCCIYLYTYTYTSWTANVTYIRMVSVAIQSPGHPRNGRSLSTKSINSISFLSSHSRKCPCPRHHHTERHSSDVQLRLENHARTELLFQAVELAAIDVLLRPVCRSPDGCLCISIYIYIHIYKIRSLCMWPACLYMPARALSVHARPPSV